MAGKSVRHFPFSPGGARIPAHGFETRGVRLSGIGEFAYTLLLGWMRGLVDWFWSMSSGTGNTGAWSWFLSNWKIWLVILLVGGLVVDWVMWIVRWRPYRLLLKKPQTAASGGPEEAWDSGVGYYEPETAMDAEEPSWADTTFASLSEIDPDWAGDVIITDEDEPLYDPDYAPRKPTLSEAQNAMPAAEGYYDDEDDVRPQESWPEVHGFAYTPEPAPSAPVMETVDLYEKPAVAQGLDPFAPYDAYPAQDEAPYEEPAPDVYEAPAQQAPQEETGPLMYGRPGLWPGMKYPFSNQGEDVATDSGEPQWTPEPEPEIEEYDPLFNPDAPQPPAQHRSRRRRRMRESSTDSWRVEEPQQETYLPSWVDTPLPPSEPYPDDDYGNDVTPPVDDKLLTSAAMPGAEKAERPAKRKRKNKGNEVDGLRTVTGKPAKPRGLLRFSLQEEPIHGLPPMELTNPFHPPVQPDNPDFIPDEGEEFSGR